jgi:hypothetical protein
MHSELSEVNWISIRVWEDIFWRAHPRGPTTCQHCDAKMYDWGDRSGHDARRKPAKDNDRYQWFAQALCEVRCFNLCQATGLSPLCQITKRYQYSTIVESFRITVLLHDCTRALARIPGTKPDSLYAEVTIKGLTITRVIHRGS